MKQKNKFYFSLYGTDLYIFKFRSSVHDHCPRESVFTENALRLRMTLALNIIFILDL